MCLIKENVTLSRSPMFENKQKNKEQNWLSEKKSNDKAMQQQKQPNPWVVYHSIAVNHSHHSMVSKSVGREVMFTRGSIFTLYFGCMYATTQNTKHTMQLIVYKTVNTLETRCQTGAQNWVSTPSDDLLALCTVLQTQALHQVTPLDSPKSYKEVINVDGSIILWTRSIFFVLLYFYIRDILDTL